MYKTIECGWKTELERKGRKQAKSKVRGSCASWVSTLSIFFNVVAVRVLTWSGNQQQMIHTVINQRKVKHSPGTISRKASKLKVLISCDTLLFLTTIPNFIMNFKPCKIPFKKGWVFQFHHLSLRHWWDSGLYLTWTSGIGSFTWVRQYIIHRSWVFTSIWKMEACSVTTYTTYVYMRTFKMQ